MKRIRLYIILVVMVVAVIIVWLATYTRPGNTETIRVPVKTGQFEISVTTTGELEAKSSEKILGPANLRNFRIWQVKIEDIIPDGTVIDSGDYVASLDRTELVNKMKDMELDVEKFETQYTKTQLDTTLELRTARDNLINLKYALEEKQIVVDQSIYEPPATQRQAMIELDKSKRAYEQATENYELKLEKAEADMKEVSANLRKAQQEYRDMVEILGEFTIYAPKSGMVIYRRDWEGKKQGIGAQVNVWEPVVAELPNLKEMISKTYVNEIDISKVKRGQDVEVGVDAFPDRSYTGKVIEVANIGQQLPNSNAKVFEVIIEVNEYDSILRPAMTTKNEIITAILDSVIYIPIECIRANDSMTYVYVSGARQQVIPGRSNENEIIIVAGLSENDMVYLVPPDDAEEMRWKLLDPQVISEHNKKNAVDEKEVEMPGEESKRGMRPPRGRKGMERQKQAK